MSKVRHGKAPRHFDVRKRAKDLPDCPGVYSFLDEKGAILYIGKARDLRKRVGQYSKPHSYQIPAMLEKARALEFTVTRTEREALILESSMVRYHKPMYNVRLKDDKHFPYLKLTKERYPRLLFVRRTANDSAKYFGPFVGGPITKTLRFVRRTFGLRPCNKMLPNGCIYGDIHVCLAPCRGGCTDEDYDRAVAQAIKYLSGDHQELMTELEQQMDRLSEAQEFEKAAFIRDQIKVISSLASQQRVDFLDQNDRDATIVRRLGPQRALVLHYSIRNGAVVAKKNFSLDVMEGHDEGQMLEAFMTQYYGNASPPPDILINVALPGKAVLEEWLSSLKGKKVRITVPKKGPNKKLLDLLEANLKALIVSMDGQRPADETYNSAAAELQAKLGLDGPPHTIEAYDISTIQGTYSVGSKVSFRNGRPEKKGYRRFKIKFVEGQDDFAMIAEVVTRRLGHIDTDPLPDLFLIDGGKGQLASALDAAARRGVKVPMISLAKQDEEVFAPGSESPVPIIAGSPAMFVLMRARDEAHRFAIDYHRKVRSKGQIASKLDSITGLGDAKRTALLRRFGSVRGIREASEDELCKVEGIGPALSKRIKEALR